MQGEGHKDEVGRGEFKRGDIRLFDADVGDAGTGNVGGEAVGHCCRIVHGDDGGVCRHLLLQGNAGTAEGAAEIVHPPARRHDACADDGKDLQQRRIARHGAVDHVGEDGSGAFVEAEINDRLRAVVEVVAVVAAHQRTAFADMSAWKEERTIGPEATWVKPIFRPSSVKIWNSSGV